MINDKLIIHYIGKKTHFLPKSPINNLRMDIISLSGQLLGNSTGTEVNYFRISKVTNHGLCTTVSTKLKFRNMNLFSDLVFGFSIIGIARIVGRDNCSSCKLFEQRMIGRTLSLIFSSLYMTIFLRTTISRDFFSSNFSIVVVLSFWRKKPETYWRSLRT